MSTIKADPNLQTNVLPTDPVVGIGRPPSKREWLLTLAAACMSSAIVGAGVSQALPHTWSHMVHAVVSVLIATVVVSLGFYSFRVHRMIERTKDLGATPLAQRRAALSDLSRRVIGSMIEQSDLNYSINLLLSETACVLPASRGYLVRYRDRRQWMEVTHQWIADQQSKPHNFVKGLDTVNIGWWNQSLLGDKPLAIDDIDKAQMPADIYTRLRDQGVRSILAAPVFIYGELEGFFAFDSTSTMPEPWKRDEILIVGNMVDAFARAVERHVAERQQTAAANRMEKALASAEAESRAKTDFLANMSHEIRTPMAAVVGYADMLQRPEQSPDQLTECVEHIRRNADHLLSLVNDILDLSKIEAGELSMRVEPCNLLAIVDQVCSRAGPPAREKMLKFKVDYQGKVPETIHTDPVRFRQILLNLVGNAIKFTDEGSVTICIELCDQPPKSVREFLRIADRNDKHAWLKIDVIDTGIGIPSAQISRLFSPFTQVHDQSERRYGGTGLGLDISRRLAHMLGADITVESKEGEGSIFTLHADVGLIDHKDLVDPAQLIEEEKKPTAVSSQSQKIPGLRVLVVDDNVDNRRIARFFLEDAQSQVTEVGNGRDAINKVVEARNQGQPFDLILMDMQMPVMDGYTATAKLREMGITVPIIALTAYTMADDRRKCINAGCNDYVSKPIVANVLYERINEQITGNSKNNNDHSISTSPSETAVSAEVGKDQKPSKSQAASSPTTNTNEESTQSPPALDLTQEQIKPVISQLADNPDFSPLLKAYMQRLPVLIEQIETNWAIGNISEVATTVHQLKGTGANYGYPDITETAKTCEQAIRSELPMSQVQPLLQSVLRCMRGAILGFESANPQTNQTNS